MLDNRLILLVFFLSTPLFAAGGCGPDDPPGLEAPGGRAETLAPGGFLPLSTAGSRILDAAGRQVILRGVQHHSLQDVDYQGREVYPGDYGLIASWGFTTLRMAISWSKIEPRQGSYETAYLTQIKREMDLAAAAGLTVILEWHQDFWGRCSQAKDSIYRVNANGAPDWTCPGDYSPSALGYWQIFDEFWANKDGLLDAFTAAWIQVIRAVGSHPALLGYDFLNEPQGTGAGGALEQQKYYPALRTVIPKLRTAGAKGLIFIDATGQRNESFEQVTEPLTGIGPNLVYAPHLYSGWLRMYMLKTSVDPAEKKRDFELAAEQAKGLGLPLWNGEWGVNLMLEDALQDLQTHVAQEEIHRIGSSYWAFQRAVPGQGDDSISGGQSLLNGDRSVRWKVVDCIARPYPIQTPGTVTTLAFDLAQKSLTVKATVDDTELPMVLYTPKRHLGEHRCLTVSGPGGFSYQDLPETQRLRLRFHAKGSYTLTLKPCP